MTGTALTEATEFMKIYKLGVVQIPTNRPMVRDDRNDQVYKTKEGKWSAVVREIAARHATGQPVLVGTISVEVSELLARAAAAARGIEHTVLNAKPEYAEREGETIAEAGRPGAVTIATNMAGRGVDIKLGGNAEHLTRARARQARPAPGDPDYDEHVRRAAAGDRARASRRTASSVLEAGGLFIIGTERHESRRIDNQLRGRAGRQGDPGESRFFLSAEDDLSACSPATGSTRSSTASARSTTRATRSRSRPACSPSRSRRPSARSRSRTSSSASACSSTTTS